MVVRGRNVGDFGLNSINRIVSSTKARNTHNSVGYDGESPGG